MFKTILVPVDGSGHAKKAVEIAADLAGKYGSRLILFHVVGSGRLPEGLHHMAEVEHIEKERRDGAPPVPDAMYPARFSPGDRDHGREVWEFVGKTILSRARKTARDHGAANVEEKMEDGDPAAAIIAAAKRESADAVVMGSRGLSDLKGLLIGSVSHKVSHLAPCTCIAVR